MPDDPPRYDPDERFSLHPMDGEDVLRRLLGSDRDEDEDETPEGGEL